MMKFMKSNKTPKSSSTNPLDDTPGVQDPLNDPPLEADTVGKEEWC
jgi:hypothetical protein